MMSPPIDIILPLVVVHELMSCFVFDSKGFIVNVLVMGSDI